MRVWRRLGAALAAVMAVGTLGGASADTLSSAALARLEPGQYALTVVGETTPPRLVCLADAAMLVQLRHPGATCSHLLIADSADAATVNYHCAAGGHGRTVVTITTPRSFDLQTQGIAGGAPFDVDYQGRRVGACGARATASR